tara:strand:+ start:131 stop:1081 length:951 start_codon:yes stop_codon:yes gene_type:complete
MTNIGKITKIPIRDEFPHEAHNFTPWLKENLHYIEEKLHLSFGDVNNILTEVPVGPYFCDVLAETIDGKKVVIENQFQRADHDHLGKMLTYAAGLNADMLIWIAEEFRDEEIATLNWLNRISPDDTPVFFALEMELIKIGNSEPALNVNIVVKPDEWTKKVQKAKITKQANMKAEIYFEFWSNFIEYFSRKRNELKTRTPPKARYINIPSQTKGFEFTILFEGGKIPAIQLWIGKNSKEENEIIYNKLKKHQEKLESTLSNLIWINDPDLKSSRIIFQRDIEHNFSDEERDDVFEWFMQSLEKFEKSFNPLLENLN